MKMKIFMKMFMKIEENYSFFLKLITAVADKILIYNRNLLKIFCRRLSDYGDIKAKCVCNKCQNW